MTEAIAWLIERSSDPTFPRVSLSRASADALADYVNVNPPVTIRPLSVCEWLPVANYPDDNSIVLVANPDEGRLPVVAWKVEDKWFKYDLSEREPLDPQPTIWTEWPKMPKASPVTSQDGG